MQDTSSKIVPGWAWAILAIAVVVIAIALMMTDTAKEPGESLVYDVSEYEASASEDLRYTETGRIDLNMEYPSALALDPEGNILVAGDGVFVTLDANGKEKSRTEINGHPRCMAVAPDGIIYFGLRNHVAVLDKTGAPSLEWETLVRRAWLTSIAVNETSVFVADAGCACVYHYDREGTLLNTIGKRDMEKNIPGFTVPSHYFDVALDPMDSLWIVHPGKLGVENYRYDGTLLSAWYQPGFKPDQFPGCCNPAHIAFTSKSIMIAAQKGINCVKAFAADHSFIGVAAPPELLEAGWKPADFPDDMTPIRDLLVDANDRILVLHGPLNTILIFEPKTEPVEKQ